MNTSLCKVILEYMKKDPSGMRDFIETFSKSNDKYFDLHDSGMILPSEIFFIKICKKRREDLDKYKGLINYLAKADCDVANELYFKLEDYYCFINYLFNELTGKDAIEKEKCFTVILETLIETEVENLEFKDNLEVNYVVGEKLVETYKGPISYDVKSDGIINPNTKKGIVRYINPSYILKITKIKEKTSKKILMKSLQLNSKAIKSLKNT